MAAAELKLQVGLDLAFFRQQLALLGPAAAGYSLPINIDRLAIQRELNSLGANINRRKYRLEVATNIAAEIKNAGTLAKALRGLDNAIQKNKGVANRTAGGAAGSAVDASKLEKSLKTATRPVLESVYNEMDRLGIRMAKAANDAGKTTNESLRAAILSGIPQVTADMAQGLAKGINPLMKINGQKGAKLFIEAWKDAAGIASPSKVFKALGEFSADGLEIGFINGLKDFKNKSVDEIRKIVALLKFELAKISGVSMAPAMSRSTGARGSQAYMSPIGPLPHGSKEPWAFSQGGYQPFMAQPGQTRGGGAFRSGAPSIMGTISSPSMFGASFPALPSAGMTGGGGAYRQAQLQSRMAAAYARSAAREASVLGESQMYARVSGQVPLGNTARRLPAGSRGGALALRNAGAQTPLSLDYYKNAFKYSEALKVADASMRNFSASQIPFLGGLRGVAGELGQATKQVLLYGTAYRALAAITAIPGQILDAAKSQQQYTNGLKVATQETGTFAKELLFVDNVQRAFGLNLETTRTGFTRLYASMAPTGFDSGSIEKLFTGISAATAALQLTPDKAERVIYAFGQMASKGQIMSEELKGQLGDVLPGALAIFAKSAGMSVKEFSKAMEDGEFIGNRFREVFAKVSDELMNRFGTGAQAAGKSLQGLINTVGGDFKRTLESFAPMVDAAAQATLGPLSGMLKQVSMAAQLAMGEQERVKRQLEDSQKDVSALKVGGASAKEIKAAEQNVAALAAKYELLNDAAKDPAIAQQVQNIQNFTEQIGKAGTFTMNLAGSIGRALSPVLSLLGSNLTTVISLVTSFYVGFQTARLAAMALMGVLLAYRTISAILGFGPATLSANGLAGAFRGLGIAATGAQVQVVGLRLALTALVASTVVGAVVAGIMLVAGAFATVGNKAKEAADKAKQSMDSMRDAALQGNTSLITIESGKAAQQIKDLEALRESVLAGKTEITKFKNSISTMFAPSQGQRKLAEIFGVTLPLKASGETIKRIFDDAVKAQQEIRKDAATLTPISKRREAAIGLNKPTPDGAAGLDEDPKKKQSLESYYKLEDDLAKAVTQGEIDKANMLFEHRKNLLDTYYDLQDARANSFQKATIRFQREVANIEMERQKNALNARNNVRKAEGSVAGGTSGGTGAIFGDTGRTFNAKGFVHGHFQNQNREALVQDTVETVMGLLDKGVSPELGSGARFTSGMNTKQVEALVRQGIGSHKQYASGVSAIDVFVPKGTQVPVPVSGIQNLGGAGGFAGTLARGSQLMHLDRASRTQGVGAARKVTGNESRDINAAQKTQIELDKENLALRQANVLAIKRQEIAMENYVAEIMPLAEQKLQNQLLAQRNQLQLSGAGDAEIEQKTKAYELDYKRLDLEKNINALRQKKTLTDVEAAQLKTSAAALAELNKGYDEYIANLAEARRLRAESSYSSNMDSLRKQLQLASILDPYDEQRQKYIQEDQSPEQADAQVQAQKQLDTATKLRDSYRELASTIGTSFGDAFKGIITGSMTAQEALASFFQNLSNYFADAVSKMIAEWLKVEAIKGLTSLLGGLGGMFGGGGGSPLSNLNAPQTINNPLGFTAANGGIAAGGFRAFATGGIVTGPTLGLVGEGRYNEAVIPLPDGKSVPVDLGGLSGGMSNAPIMVNVSVDAKGSTVEGDENRANDLGRAISVAVQSELIKQQRPGGLLASTRR